MVFTSVQFIIFFSIFYLIFVSIPQRFKLIFVLASSLFFFGYQNPTYLWLLLFVIFICYVTGLAISTSYSYRKIYLVACITTLLGLLGYFKYADFLISQADQGLQAVGSSLRITPIGILLPIGISFFVFQAISYVVDVYRGDKKAERNILVLALFKAYFPQLVAGPIERAPHLLPAIRRAFVERGDQAFVDRALLQSGSQLILLGFFKKLVIADNIGVYADHIFANPTGHSALTTLLGVYCFSLQIYCDFSGYTDIARGVSRLMGIDLVENFRRPYFSRSIREFWTRWHISLSTWFRDYLFKPLGGSRVSTPRWIFNILVVFLLSGLWHGAAVNFLIWGAIHGLIYIAEQTVTKVVGRSGLDMARLPNLLRQVQPVVATLLTFHVVCFAWIFFRATSFSEATAVIGSILRPVTSLITGNPGTSPPPTVGIELFHRASFAWIALLAAALLVVEAQSEWGRGQFSALWQSAPLRWTIYYLAAIAIVFFGNWNNAQQFIYFQF